MNYDKELDIQINVERMKKALSALSKSIIAQGLRERTVEQKVSSWKLRLETYQKEGMPLILQQSCLENLIKYNIEKIYKDHCRL